MAKAFEIHAKKETVMAQLIDWRSEISSSQSISGREKDLRLQLANRLLFQVERKFQDSDLRHFMIETLKDMKMTDEMRGNQSYGGMNEYLENLQEALSTLIEPRENVVNFIRDFTQYCSVEKPLSVDQFAETRDYSDGRDMEKAETMTIDDAAESVALQIAKDDEEKAAEAAKKEKEEDFPRRDYLSLQQNLKQDSEFKFVLPVQEKMEDLSATEVSVETSETSKVQSPETSH